MSVGYTLLALLAFVVLTLGTAVFVAAEFSLTALERSTVDANARTGGRRDQLVQRAHRTLSFQLSGAQVGISITTLITGYLAEPLIARLLRARASTALALPESVAGGLALALALLIATSVSMVFGELVPKNLAVAKPLADRARGGRAAGAVLDAVHPGDQADQRHRQLDPAPARHRARRGAALGALAAGAGLAGAQLRAPRRPGLRRRPRWWTARCSSATRTAEELMTPRSKIEALQADDTVADLVAMAMETGYSRFPIVDGDLDETVGIVHVKQVFEVPPDDRPRTRLAGAGAAGARWCRRRSTATT